MKKNDWKDRLHIVYSTNPDFQYEENEEVIQDTASPERQPLRVSIEKKGRGGKVVTLIKGFIGRPEDLKELGKMLKNKCGVGGSEKEGEIIIQGDHRTKIVEILQKAGYSKAR